jgi:hypothetical protein
MCRSPLAIALSIIRGKESPPISVRSSKRACLSLQAIIAGKPRPPGVQVARPHQRNTTPSVHRSRVRPSPGVPTGGSVWWRVGLVSCHSNRRARTRGRGVDGPSAIRFSCSLRNRRFGVVLVRGQSGACSSSRSSFVERAVCRSTPILQLVTRDWKADPIFVREVWADKTFCSNAIAG